MLPAQLAQARYRPGALLHGRRHKKGMGSFASALLKIATGSAMAQLINFGLTPLLTRSFSPADFGHLSLVTSTAAFLVPLATLKLELGIPLESEQGNAHALAKSLMRLATLTGLVTTAVIWILVQAQQLHSYWLALGLIVSGIAWGYIVCSSLARNEQFGIVARFAVTNSIVRSLLPLALASTLIHEHALILSFALGQVIASGLAWHRLHKTDKDDPLVHWRDAWGRHANFIKYSLPSDLVQIASMQVTPSVLMVISSADFVGKYALALRVIAAPGILIASSVSKIFYPRIAKADLNDHPQVIESMIRNLSLLSVAMFGLAFAFAPVLIVLLFGARWAESASIARILVPYLAINLLSASVATYLLVRGKQRSAGIVSVANSSIRLACIFGGAHFAGEYGAIVGYSAGGILNSLFITIWVLRLSRVRLVRLARSLCLPLFLLSAAVVLATFAAEYWIDWSVLVPGFETPAPFEYSR